MRRRPRMRILGGMMLLLALALAGGAVGDAVALASSAGRMPGRPSAEALASTRGQIAAKHPATTEVTLTQGASAPGVPVTMPVVGLSMEYPTMATDLGSAPCPPPALVSALQQLGSPPVALAGNSQDLTAPSGVLVSAPSSWEMAILYTLPASFWSQLHCLLSASHDPLTVGLNLKTGQPSWAAQMVAEAQSAATNGLNFSLGNEPDLYPLPNYAALAHRLPDEEAVQVRLYLQLASAMRPVLAGAPVIGPELSSAVHWQHELPRVIAQTRPEIVGVHAYPLSACLAPKSVTVEGLLTPYAADEPDSLAWVVKDARAAGLPAIISEANSVSCGGLAGVSNTPAAAVWAVRFVLSALKTGFHEVRFHFASDPYDAFIVRGSEVIKRPMDYGLVALNQWLPVGASLRSVTVPGLVATSVTGTAGQTLLILDNEHAKAQKLTIRGTHSVHVETLSPTAAGVHSANLSSASGRVKLTIAPNSVVALSAVAAP